LSQGGIQALAFGGPALIYPSPALLIYAFLIRLFANPLAAYFCLAFSICALAFVTCFRAMRRAPQVTLWGTAAAVLTLVCSYPLLFGLDRGNIEIVVVFFLLCGLIFFARRNYLAAAVIFALAGCFKPFPLLFFYLFLVKRR